MRRPDQDRFDQFAAHFGVLDDSLHSFAMKHHFILEKNLLRQPGRVLRKRGNPESLIDLSLSEHWLATPFSEDMPHTMLAIAYYEPPESSYIWKMSRDVFNGERFSKVVPDIFAYLEKARLLLNQWTSEVILSQGEPIENLRKRFDV